MKCLRYKQQQQGLLSEIEMIETRDSAESIVKHFKQSGWTTEDEVMNTGLVL